jgi:hypothetical protein
LPYGTNPQADVTPQGFDIGQFAQQIAGQAVPGLIMGLLSAHPQLRAQSAGPQGVAAVPVQCLYLNRTLTS